MRPGSTTCPLWVTEPLLANEKRPGRLSKPIVVGALVIGAFLVGVVYLEHDAAGPTPSTLQSAPGKAIETPPAAAPGASVSPGTPSEPGRAQSQQAPTDARLAVLRVSADNGLIEFVRGPDGKVIAEIDKDPGSPSFKKPMREYVYSGDTVIGLTAYRYFPDHTEISRTRVAYKPDGSVDRIDESTSFESGKKK